MNKPKVLATICGRGGSVGVKGKNVRALLGKPMLHYTLECVQKSEMIDEVIISTDSDDIIRCAEDFGIKVDYRRPDELATAEAPKNLAIRHATEFVEEKRGFYPDIVADLDIGVPLKKPKDIDEAIRKLWESPDMECIVSVYPAERNPYFNMVEQKNDGFFRVVEYTGYPVFSRQSAPKVYSVTPAIFAWKRNFMHLMHLFEGKWGIYEMPLERSVDIDTEFEYQLIKFLMTQYNA